MKLLNLKLNIVKSKRAFAVIFSVLAGSIMLTIALITATLAEKEVRLSSLAEKSRIAFYAADAGMECALFLDVQKDLFKLEGANLNPGSNLSDTGSCYTYTDTDGSTKKVPLIVKKDSTTDTNDNNRVREVVFHMPIIKYTQNERGSLVYTLGRSCAIVQIKKYVNRTEIWSFGRDVKWNNTQCEVGRDGVERAIRSDYSHNN
jgi:hypothetical protein